MEWIFLQRPIKAFLLDLLLSIQDDYRLITQQNDRFLAIFLHRMFILIVLSKYPIVQNFGTYYKLSFSWKKMNVIFCSKFRIVIIFDAQI